MMPSAVVQQTMRERRRWKLLSIALILVLASIAALTHDGPWTAERVAVLEAGTLQAP
jgi:hypothetical protein